MGAPSGFFEGWDSGRVEENLALELLPSSGSGITELYRSRSGGRNRLYKVLSPQYRGNLLYESILRKEFEIGFSLTHQGICAYYGFINLHGLGNAIELEWIEGCTLREWLALNPSRKQRRLILDQLLDALSYMHRKQVVHRDLKPENIMVTYQGNHVKIIDFGFSDSDAHAVNKGPAGTQAYAAPELLEGKGPDQRSDIYSVGLIMDELTPWLGRITRKCKAPDPEKRYQSVSELQKSVLSRRRIWIIPAVVAAAATVVLAAHNRTYSDSEVDALVREAEEAISSTISLSE
ncbi:MAG: serine/threonine protein kinase [Bacteroidales bacterium]|nr:serine/threonine protein kinase [Bacteroidales bacterium]